MRWFCISLILAAIPAMAEEKVKVTGDVIRGDTNKKMTYIEGNVRITQGTDHITSEKAEINLDEKRLLLNGAVIFENADVSVHSDVLDYFMKKKIGMFSQNVILKRKESQAKDGSKKDPFNLAAAELYFEVKTRNFTATGGKIEHKDFTGNADRIEYNDSKQELLFIGNSYLKKAKGEEVWGEVTRINLKKKTFKVEKNVVVHFNVDDEKETQLKAVGEPVKPGGNHSEPGNKPLNSKESSQNLIRNQSYQKSIAPQNVM